jgi:hypothetical protein
MAIREWMGRLWWPAPRRRRVLAQAEREQARESEEARRRLLRYAAEPVERQAQRTTLATV